MDHPSPIPSRLQAPSELELSPRKARLNAANAQTWLLITSWLSKLYGTVPVPPFERNADTLAALQQLMHANAAADHARKLLHEARKEELAAYEAAAEERGALREHELFREMEAELSKEGGLVLDSLAKASVLLGLMPSASTGSSSLGSDLGTRIMSTTHEQFTTENQLRQIDVLRTSLEREMQRTQLALDELKAQEDEARMESVHAQTVQWTRETKQVGLKLAEYKERIAGLERFGQEGLTIEEVRDREKILEEKRNRLTSLENRLRLYHGLPPDIHASRLEIRRAESELGQWKRKREQLFEELGGG